MATYRRVANHDGYIIDDPDVPITTLLVTTNNSTDGCTDEITHLNDGELLTDEVEVLQSFATDLLASTATIGS